ncbi:MAG: hypothetical protein ACRBF0_08280 [Calditrichia bacterium]
MGFKHPELLSDYLIGGISLTDVFFQVNINSDVALYCERLPGGKRAGSD